MALSLTASAPGARLNLIGFQLVTADFDIRVP